MKKKVLIQTIVLIIYALCPIQLKAQINYQNTNNKNFSFGGYGRVGVDWSYVNGGSIGRRLNLNNMGSIGGRMEEQDYLEMVSAMHFIPQKTDSTIINIQVRLAMFSTSLSLLGNSSTNSLGGINLAMPELFAEARNIGGNPLSIWIGSRLYRGPDVHIADHFYFNDHSGQGFGIEYKSTRFCAIYVSSTDTSATLPPYFYLNIGTGTPSPALRQRVVLALEQDLHINDNQTVTLLGEFHRMGDGSPDIEISPYNDTITQYPSDFGLVIGARLNSRLNLFKGASNNFTIRYGSRLANGGDGGISRTSQTFGAPDINKQNFEGAYSLAIVNDLLINLSETDDLNPYLIYTKSKGGSTSDSTAITYFGREVYNQKEDLTIGMRHVHYFTNMFQLISEVHYSQRRDGVEDKNAMFKFSLAPTLVPTGEKDYWARPHFRFVFSAARYNDAAMKNLYSPYLAFVGSKRWGYYFGVKAEWWLF